MLIRQLILTLTLLVSACGFRLGPSDTARMAGAEDTSLVNKITGTYCYCNQPDDPVTYTFSIGEIGDINIEQLKDGSLIFVAPVGRPATGLAVRISSEYESMGEEEFGDATGGCFVLGRKVRCNVARYRGVALGIGWYWDTIDFSKKKSGALKLRVKSGECGLGFLVIPFCEPYAAQLILPKVTPDQPCRCETASE